MSDNFYHQTSVLPFGPELVSDNGRYVNSTYYPQNAANGLWTQRRRSGMDIRMLHRGHLLACALWFLGSAACTKAPDGDCFEDSDCTGNDVCLFDVERNITYCTATGCVSDDGCPRFQSCSSDGICVNLIRQCDGEEVINGLDDNCDGVVDEAGAEFVTGCVDDSVCGAYVCGAPQNQATTVCQPPIENTKAAGACTRDEECENGVCVTGHCSEVCAQITSVCTPANVEGLMPSVCVRAVGQNSANRPIFNQCQPECFSPAQCPAPYQCAWRGPASTVMQLQGDYAFVCTLTDDARAPLGAACSGNNRAGDDECAHGLCLGPLGSSVIDPKCTRPCGGINADCSDVGPDYTCQMRELNYGGVIIATNFVCSRGMR